MTGFTIKIKDVKKIRFAYYLNEAPITSKAFDEALPFTQTFYHAKVSGEEIWTDKAPELNIIQENASVFVNPGEVVVGPTGPARNKVINGIGILYGEGKLLDCANIFAKVFDEDLAALRTVSDKFWSEGFQKITFEKLD